VQVAAAFTTAGDKVSACFQKLLSTRGLPDIFIARGLDGASDPVMSSNPLLHSVALIEKFETASRRWEDLT
jgi:hypothetical protein